VWFKPAEHSVHYYVGHDHFLQAHLQESAPAEYGSHIVYNSNTFTRPAEHYIV
jgi:hypothetical protein